MSESHAPPEKPNPVSVDIKPGESFVHDQQQFLKNGNYSAALFHILGLTPFIPETQFSTPTPVYPSFPVEMDSLS